MKPTFGWILAAMIVAGPASAQTMYRCHDQGKVIYSDKPCLNGEEAKQMMPNGNPTPEYLARLRMKARAEEQRAMNAQAAAKREAYPAKKAGCESGAARTVCKP
ncbi:MAG: DUF4124 domain-containing protein [Burkholderiales bacterium]